MNDVTLGRHYVQALGRVKEWLDHTDRLTMYPVDLRNQEPADIEIARRIEWAYYRGAIEAGAGRQARTVLGV